MAALASAAARTIPLTVPLTTRLAAAFAIPLAGALALLLASPPGHAQAPPPAVVPDTLAQRLLACTGCHGAQGRATAQGYFPRIAGKPAEYLHRQLLNFRDGRRRHAAMAALLQPLDDSYLRQIAQHFADQDPPHPPPAPATAGPAALARGEQLARRGDPARGLPACTACHGTALTGVGHAVPALLGLPSDYLTVQLGGWRSGQRQADAPDCMARIAQRLGPSDVIALAAWLAAQPVPADHRPAAAAPVQPAPLPCGATQSAPVAPADPRRPPAPPAGDLVLRGAYLARLGHCAGCHTAPGGLAYAGGRAIDTPFGRVVPGNLTPDPQHGLGRWQADDFWRALHEGRGLGGRRLLPVFPYPSYTRLQRADSDALFAYLRSLAPVAQPNPPHALRFPYNTGWALAVWQWLFFEPQVFTPQADRSPAWNRGAYLAQGLGHCAECHAPRNALGALADGGRPVGARLPGSGWHAPSLLLAQEAGVATWPRDELARWLRTGQTPRGTAQGPMAEVVQGSTQHLSDADAWALAEYLQALPGAATASATPATPATQATQAARPLPPTAPPPVPPARPGASASDPPPAPAPSGPTGPMTEAQRLAMGQQLYTRHCADCHGRQGEGGRTAQGAPAYPALAGSRLLALAPPGNLIRTVLQGGFAPSTAGQPQPYGMPPTLLNDDEVAAVLSHLRHRWAPGAPPVTALQVRRVRDGQDGG